MAVDLHIHTTASDGWLTPVQVIHQAKAAGLTGIAITDHDTVDGLKELQESGYLDDEELVVVPGIEFSTDLPANEVHILGYGIDVKHGELNEYMELLVKDRSTRVEKILAKLAALGYPLEYGRVRELAGESVALGRPHVAKALLEKGYFSTVAEVFDQLLIKNGPAYVPHYKLQPREVIQLIHRAGGIAVLAHPGQVQDDAVVGAVINDGLDGLEVYHPYHSAKEFETYREMALGCELLITGGSDFHGIPGRFPEELGVFVVNDDALDGLQKRLRFKK